MLGGDSTVLEYQPHLTILSLKDFVKRRLGPDPDKQRLLYKEQELKVMNPRAGLLNIRTIPHMWMSTLRIPAIAYVSTCTILWPPGINIFRTTTRRGEETLIRYVIITFKISETQLLFVIETVLNHYSYVWRKAYGFRAQATAIFPVNRVSSDLSRKDRSDSASRVQLSGKLFNCRLEMCNGDSNRRRLKNQ